MMRSIGVAIALAATGAVPAKAAIDFQQQAFSADFFHFGAPVLGDFDGDGLADLVAGRNMVTRNADRSFALSTPWIENLEGVPVIAHDALLDGARDVIAATDKMGACETRRYDDATSTPYLEYFYSLCADSGGWREADLDSNGSPDLLTAFDYSSGTVWHSSKLGEITMAPGGPEFPLAVAAADINGDRRQDLIGLMSDGQVLRSLAAGGGFSTPTSFSGGTGAGALAAADLNNDGKAEIITASPTAVTVRTASGFVSTWPVPTFGGHPPTGVSLALADVDGDGWQDMLVGTTTNPDIGGPSHVLIRVNRGALVFDSPVSIQTVPPAHIAVANGKNGRLDAVAVGGGSMEITTLVNRSTASAAFATATTSFWDVEVGTSSEPQALTFKNTGYDTLHVERGHLTGLDAASYKLDADGCQGAVLKRNQSCTFSVRFAPIGDGIRNAALRVLHDGDGAATQTALTGIGTVPATAARSQAQPTPASAGPAPAPAPVVAVAGPQGPKGDPGRDGRDGRDGSLQCAGSAGVCTLDLALSPGVIRVSAELRRAGRLVARGKARPGSRLRLDAKRKLRPGRYRLRLVRIGRDGARTVVNRTIRIR